MWKRTYEMKGVYSKMAYKQPTLCPVCGTQCDENTTTCPVCGTALQSEMPKVSSEIETEEDLKEEQRKELQEEQGAIEETKTTKAKKTMPKSTVAAVLLGVLSIILLCVVGVQSNAKQSLKKALTEADSMIEELENSKKENESTIQENEKKISDNEKKISDLEESISELKTETRENVDTIEQYKKEVEEYKEQVEEAEEAKEQVEKELGYYENVWGALSKKNLGSASSKFFVSESVVVLHKSDPAKYITLTADLGPTTIRANRSSIYFPDSSGAAAIVTFSGEWNNWTIKLEVKPQTEGTVLYEFTNDVNSDKFYLVVIVLKD